MNGTPNDKPLIEYLILEARNLPDGTGELRVQLIVRCVATTKSLDPVVLDKLEYDSKKEVIRRVMSDVAAAVNELKEALDKADATAVEKAMARVDRTLEGER